MTNLHAIVLNSFVFWTILSSVPLWDSSSMAEGETGVGGSQLRELSSCESCVWGETMVWKETKMTEVEKWRKSYLIHC